MKNLEKLNKHMKQLSLELNKMYLYRRNIRERYEKVADEAPIFSVEENYQRMTDLFFALFQHYNNHQGALVDILREYQIDSDIPSSEIINIM